MSNSSGLRNVTDDLLIRKELDLIALYIGSEDLTDIQATAAIDFIKTQFGGLTLSDLSEAVKMALAGKLRIENLDYTKKLSAVWLGKVLRAYSDQKTLNNTRNPVDPNALKLDQFTGQKGKERTFYESLEKWYNEHKEMPQAWPYSLARKWIKDNGLLVTKEDKDEVKKLAMEYLMNQPQIFKRVDSKVKRSVKRKLSQEHLDRAVLELHLKRKHEQQNSQEPRI